MSTLTGVAGFARSRYFFLAQPIWQSEPWIVNKTGNACSTSLRMT